MKVVELPRPVGDLKLIAYFEDLLADAKAGKVRSFVGVAFNGDTHEGQRYAHNAYTMHGIGACYMLLSWVTLNWENAPSLPDPAGSV